MKSNPRRMGTGSVLAFLILFAWGCGGPGAITSIDPNQHVGLSRPGEGEGLFFDENGVRLPGGLAPVPED